MAIDIYEVMKTTVDKFGGFDKSSLYSYGWSPDNGRSQHWIVRTSEKKNEVNCPVLHYIIHQESLCGQVIKESSVMKTVVNVTNVIRDGSKSLSHRKFRAFLE